MDKEKNEKNSGGFLSRLFKKSEIREQINQEKANQNYRKVLHKLKDKNYIIYASMLHGKKMNVHLLSDEGHVYSRNGLIAIFDKNQFSTLESMFHGYRVYLFEDLYENKKANEGKISFTKAVIDNITKSIKVVKEAVPEQVMIFNKLIEDIIQNAYKISNPGKDKELYQSFFHQLEDIKPYLS